MHRVENDSIALTFLPAVGGRLISLHAHGVEWLWRNPDYLDDDLCWVKPFNTWPDGRTGLDSWANIGGAKTWPAPQGWGGSGEWAGPPDPILDAGEYLFDLSTSDAETIVRMMSAPDPVSGLTIAREFRVPKQGPSFRQTTTFSNSSPAPVTWSIWEVAQIDTLAGWRLPEAGVVLSVEDDRVVDLGEYQGKVSISQSDGHAFIGVQDAVAKKGFPSASGMIAYDDGCGRRIEMTFQPVADGTYPDEGSRAEVWMQSPQPTDLEKLPGLRPDAWLVELEVLSPLVALEPGQSASWTTEWNVQGSRP